MTADLKEKTMNMSMFVPEVQILEKIVRPLIVYFFLLVTFHIVGKRKHELDPDTDLPLIKRALLEQDGTVTILQKSDPDQAHHRKTIKMPGKK